MPYSYNDQTYGDDATLVINNIRYKLRRQSPEKLAALGVSRIEPPASIDERYFQRIGDEVSPRPWEQLKSALLNHAAMKRYGKEVGGIEVMGAPIKTDRESQAMIAGAFALVQDDPQKSIKFKTSAGFVDLDAAAVTAIARAVGDHVQACFALEADVIAQIEAQEIETFEAIDQAFG